ncbi:hypothetical protein [Natrinema marinum]|uniref:hypothetical protein n=1 Tax=Natrinema marinum TaxID=2961598 RepID=UPI0020C8875B|nr:hypothetical protein [Natrinema marinum]
MGENHRRTLLKMVGAGAISSTAGCLSALSTDLNVWIRNDIDERIDYEIRIEDFEETGSVAGGEIDRFENALEYPGSGRSVEIELRFGIREGDEFFELASETDTLPIETGAQAVFARYTEMGAFYGVTDEA